MPYFKTIVALFAFLFFLPLGTQAAECDLSTEVKNLEKAQTTPAYDYLESIKLELRARKELLSAALDCVIADTENLRTEATGLAETQDTAEIKKEIIQKIEYGRDNLLRQKEQIPNLGIQGTKNMAREIKIWRNNTYVRLENEVNNLKIWNGNQSLFETAQKRLGQIKQTVRLLKLLENDEIRSMYEKSESSLKNAGSIHRQALQNIKEYRSQEEISSSLKTTLEMLSQTYKDFLDLSQTVKKILPL